MTGFGRRASEAMSTMSLGGILLVCLVAGGFAACGRGEIEKGLSGPVPATQQELMAELQTQKDRIDGTSDAMMKRIEEFNATRGPEERKVQFSELFYSDLNPEQRNVLDQLLAEEKSPTYQNLLSKIIEDRNAVQGLQEKVLRLEQQLNDKFVIAKRGDTHYKLAQDYLLSEGLTEEQIKPMLNQVDLSEDLLAGFKIWYNYDKERTSFKTYVTQGEAGRTPLAVKRALKRKLVDERDAAVAKVTALEQTKMSLEGDVARLTTDIGGLEDKRAQLEVTISDLEGQNRDLSARGDGLAADLAFRQNSLFYHAESEGSLAQQGVLTRFLKNLKDVKGISYDEAVDLRSAKTISFTPEPYGLTKISGVEIWPGIYQEGRDYTLQVAKDGTTATVVITDPNVFRQQRVLISLKGISG